MEILGYTDVPTTWILIAGIILLIYVYGKHRNRVFKDVGIPGPEPLIYIGNLHQIIKQGVRLDNPNAKKYGKVYGVFMGGYPMILVNDVDIIREVLIKNFSNFTDRMAIELDDYPINKGLVFEKGLTWKRLRNISSPTFSGAKLRMMCERINSCSEVLTQNFLKAAADKSEILIKDYFGAFTMDVIASTAFGIQTDSQNEMDSQLMKEAKKVFADGITNPLTLIVLIFPGLTKLFKYLGVASFPKQSLKFFQKAITEMIENRKADPQQKTKRPDFLQLLLDAEDDGTYDDVSKTDKADNKKMSHDEILGQALLFFVAGYETTANTLHFATYSLATNPDVQQRVIEEIDSVLGDAAPNYENIRELTYLDHVITETLRMYPIVPSLNRKTEETVVIKGFTFPKDVIVVIPSTNIHRNPDVFPDPHRFNPDRWDRKSEIDSMNYVPFGHGPRQCLGMRLAQVEMKMALAQVLKKVRFLPASDTPAVLESKDLLIKSVLATKKPLKLRVEVRTQAGD